jgi:hypothetical protein
MDIINEGNKSNLSKPNTDRTCFNLIKIKKLNENCKSILRKINLKKDIKFNIKSHNINRVKFPKIVSLYSSNSNIKLKPIISKIKSDFLSDINNSSIKSPMNKYNKKDLSIDIFKNNDIDLVQNLNPDSTRDLVSKLLLKKKLKNKLESQVNLFNYFKKNNYDDDDDDDENLKDEEEYKVLEKRLLKISQSNLIEKELNYRLQDIKKKFNIKKKNKHEINNKFTDKLKEIDNIEYDIQLLDYKSKENSLRNSQLIYPNSNDNNINKKQNMSFSFKNAKSPKIEHMRRVSKLQDYLLSQKKTDNEKKEKQNKILEIQKELKDLKKPLTLLNNEINELKTNEKNTKVELLKHYLELLYVGKEVRNEGLIWIIKSIWKLGENVPISFMPKFLDFDAIQFLFNYAKISTELEYIKKLIRELKHKLKEKVNNTQISNGSIIKEELTSRNNMFNIINSNFKDKTNFMKKFSESNRIIIPRKNSVIFNRNNIFRKKLLFSSSSPDLMKNIFNNSNFNMEEQNEKKFEIKSTMSQISKILDKKKDELYFDKMPEINEINNFQKKIISLNKQLEEMKKKEIQRIFKEYTDNEYEKVYHAPIEIVLGALIGEHARNIQMNNYNIYKKGYLDELNTIRFFEYGKRK